LKTMAIRFDDERHARLSVLAQLSNASISAIIHLAIDEYLEAKRNDPALAAQADSVLAEIDADARGRRDAIATLFGTSATEGSDKSSGTADPTRRGRKAASS
jgi:predicted transcriptional regulator